MTKPDDKAPEFKIPSVPYRVGKWDTDVNEIASRYGVAVDMIYTASAARPAFKRCVTKGQFAEKAKKPGTIIDLPLPASDRDYEWTIKRADRYAAVWTLNEVCGDFRGRPGNEKRDDVTPALLLATPRNAAVVQALFEAAYARTKPPPTAPVKPGTEPPPTAAEKLALLRDAKAIAALPFPKTTIYLPEIPSTGAFALDLTPGKTGAKAKFKAKVVLDPGRTTQFFNDHVDPVVTALYALYAVVTGCQRLTREAASEFAALEFLGRLLTEMEVALRGRRDSSAAERKELLDLRDQFNVVAALAGATMHGNAPKFFGSHYDEALVDCGAALKAALLKPEFLDGVKEQMEAEEVWLEVTTETTQTNDKAEISTTSETNSITSQDYLCQILRHSIEVLARSYEHAFALDFATRLGEAFTGNSRAGVAEGLVKGGMAPKGFDQTISGAAATKVGEMLKSFTARFAAGVTSGDFLTLVTTSVGDLPGPAALATSTMEIVSLAFLPYALKAGEGTAVRAAGEYFAGWFGKAGGLSPEKVQEFSAMMAGKEGGKPFADGFKKELFKGKFSTSAMTILSVIGFYNALTSLGETTKTDTELAKKLVDLTGSGFGMVVSGAAVFKAFATAERVESSFLAPMFTEFAGKVIGRIGAVIGLVSSLLDLVITVMDKDSTGWDIAGKSITFGATGLMAAGLWYETATWALAATGIGAAIVVVVLVVSNWGSITKMFWSDPKTTVVGFLTWLGDRKLGNGKASPYFPALVAASHDLGVAFKLAREMAEGCSAYIPLPEYRREALRAAGVKGDLEKALMAPNYGGYERPSPEPFGSVAGAAAPAGAAPTK